MPDWEKATIYESGRIEVDPSGDDWVKFLAPQFRKNDGADYGTIGFGVDFIGESIVDDPSTIGALSGFAWTANPTTDLSPGFDINLPADAVAGMELVGQYTAGNTEWLRYTLTSGDIIADSITVSGGSEMTAGTHPARFRLEDGADFSDWLVVDDIEIEEAFMKVALEGGLLYPGGWLAKAVTLTTGATLDAAAKKVAMIGRVYWDGRPGSAKTISAAGGGSISFAAGTVTFANGGSTIEIGLQDVSSTTNTPDGTFDVSRVLTGNAVSPITTAAGNTIAMTGGSGSKSLAHGDLVAVVLDMTARAGSDSVVVNAVQQAAGMLQSGGLPGVNTHNGTSWGTTYPSLPNVVFTADDGTIGTLDGAGIFATPSAGSESFNDSTNPDERGHIFRTNFDCDVDGVWLHIRPDADFTVSLYSDPLGTPASLASVAQVAEVFGGVSSFRMGFLPFSAPISLTANTDYCIAVKATEATSIFMSRTQFHNESHRALLLAGTTVKKATRNNSSGAFSAESPALSYYNGLTLRISHVHTPA